MVVMMKWIKRWIRYRFCDNEIQKGEVLIIWKDIDDVTYGWNCVADREEQVLSNVGKIMRNVKMKKLEQITGMKEKKGGGI